MHHIWLILCAHQHHWHHPLFADGTEHGPVGHDSAVQEGCFFTSLTEEIWLVQTFCHYIWVIFYVHKHHWYHLILVDVTEHGPVGHHMQEGVFFSLIEAWLMHSLCHFIWLVLWAHHQGHYPSLADGTERLEHGSDGHHSTVQRCSLHFTYGGYFFAKLLLCYIVCFIICSYQDQYITSKGNSALSCLTAPWSAPSGRSRWCQKCWCTKVWPICSDRRSAYVKSPP